MYRTRQPAALRLANTILGVAAAFAIMSATGCSSAPIATWHAVVAPTSTPPGPTATPLPGFTLSDPPPVIDHGPRTGNRVALTFDSNMTVGMRLKLARHEAESYANVKVLDILQQQHVPATFFLTGLWVEQYPDVTRRIAADPDFELANHTYTDRAYTANCYSQPVMPPADMVTDIVRTFDLIRPYGGHQTDYFRFPGLCSNRAALAAIASAHVTVIRGDVISGDPFATAVEPIVHAVLSRVRAGSIVIMHITRDNARMTDQALPPILAGLRQRGLVPVRLSELLGGQSGLSASPGATATGAPTTGVTPSTDPVARAQFLSYPIDSLWAWQRWERGRARRSRSGRCSGPASSRCRPWPRRRPVRRR